jgi:hypothetical protein
MSNYAISLKRTTLLLLALAFMAVLTIANLSIFSIGEAGAAQLATRSLVLTSTLQGSVTGTANTELSGNDATYAFTFTHPTAATVRAFEFIFCTTAIGACTGPTGLDADTTPAVTLQEDDNVAFSNAYTLAGAGNSNNTVRFINATGNAVGANSVIEFNFDDVTNSTTLGTFFVRVTTYDSDTTWNGTTDIDTGTVASSITNGIAITSRVVETLGFSTTTDDAGEVAEGASCAALGGSSSAITLGDVTEGTLSISQAYDEFSAFRLYTNAANGVIVQYHGATLTKGADNIDAIGGTATASAVGSEQFGLAVDANGASLFDGDAGGFGGAGQLTLGTEYDGGDGTITNGGTATFAFVAGTKTQMASASSFVTCDTAAVRYIGNISPLTAAGTYTTTVVYFAVPTY